MLQQCRTMDAARPNTAPVPLIGRDAEFAQLAATIDEVVSGRGRFVLLIGETGVGKTRLAEEALTLARESGGTVLVGRAGPASWPGGVRRAGQGRRGLDAVR